MVYVHNFTFFGVKLQLPCVEPCTETNNLLLEASDAIWLFLIRHQSFVSSANIRMSLIIEVGNSLTNNKNSNGPSTLPCSTLLNTACSWENIPLIPTFIVLDTRKSSSQITTCHWFPLLSTSQAAYGVESYQMLFDNLDKLHLIHNCYLMLLSSSQMFPTSSWVMINHSWSHVVLCRELYWLVNILTGLLLWYSPIFYMGLTSGRPVNNFLCRVYFLSYRLVLCWLFPVHW